MSADLTTPINRLNKLFDKVHSSMMLARQRLANHIHTFYLLSTRPIPNTHTRTHARTHIRTPRARTHTHTHTHTLMHKQKQGIRICTHGDSCAHAHTHTTIQLSFIMRTATGVKDFLNLQSACFAVWVSETTT